MLDKTKVETIEKAGTRLQPRKNKWYRYVAMTQMIVFAAMHLILGMYFAFVTSEYANHPGFTATIKMHRNMDQIFAIVCFALFVVGLRCFYGLMKHKKLSVLYYVYLAVSAILPIVYIVVSGSLVTDAMMTVLEESHPEFWEGAETSEMVYWIGIEFGAWANGGEISAESEIILNYLSRIGEEAGAIVALDDFNLKGLLGELRNDLNVWNRFELYAIINAALSAVFVVLGVIFRPVKKTEK